ncbi:MAG: hypothetical protein ABR588_06590 [Sphingomicrobium sp.]|nr:hypothetical protein [Sphingomonadales bacterium]
MIHLLPDSFAAESVTPYDEAVARLASIRAALTVAEQAAGSSAPLPEPQMPAAWPEASAAKRRCFETRSVESAQAASAGLEMLAAQRAAGLKPNPQAIGRLAETLRTELADLDRLFSL